MDQIKKLLGSNEATAKWLEHLEAIGEPDFDVVLPPPDDLPSILLQLAVPHDDIGDVVALLPQVEQSPELWWLLRRCAHSLVRTMGAVEGPPEFPWLPTEMGVIHRYFYIYVFLAVLPKVRQFHRSRHISDDVSRFTLADLGRNMAVYRKRFGVGGLYAPFWIMLHFRGAIYELGRLQFERSRINARTAEGLATVGMPYGAGHPTLSVHIPEFYGPMTPTACDASFSRARQFFAEHFPEEKYDIATCHSWLLDTQLAEYLSDQSNIIRFQRRFQIASRPNDSNESIVGFVFGRRLADLENLPQTTTLERAVVGHIKAGQMWHGGAGWLPLTAP